ncbi:thiamine ABC transporter substrate-binding protein [Deinococcus piscis]|uniref:Thiamine ABC transporter substrate-binding protein n=1 Tax=Deinococcus piscis TaxID=394230 RepID=A0ABQ3K2M9_9DEIO|nr:thiamine ABC transporter substrate-binding protein [Deinococcus piscis]GHF97289.1 thiamine ABC transporter substrate-binding protein [Deinococcus piscis]
MNLNSALKPALTLTALLSLSACTAPKPQTETQPQNQQAQSGQASAAQVSSAAGTASASSATPASNTDKIGGTLKVITHDSFALSEGLLEGFEKTTGVNVELIKAGDAGQMLSRLILTKQAPLADVVYGLDNSMLPRARAEDLLLPYRSPALSGVPADYRLDESGLLNTVDYGVVALNYDRAAWAKTGLPLPQTLDELKGKDYASRLVVPSPATSSPGLAFLLATVNELGEQGAWAWWNEAEQNGMKIVGGWSDAYNTEFTRSGGQYPLVLSYGSSPAAEVFYAEGYDPAKLPSEAPTGNLFIPGTSYLQLEGVGILKSTGNEAAARAFLDWMLSPEVQRDIPTNMWVYPAAAETPLDPVFALAETTELAPVGAELTENPQALIDAWVENVQRK